jgi:WD40 repeat protein
MVNKNQVISASSDHTLIIWKLLTKANNKYELDEFNFLLGHESDVVCLDFNNDYIASGGSDSLVIVWSLSSGSLIFKLKGHLGSVRYIYMDDFKLVTAGDAKKINVWDYKVSFLSKSSYYLYCYLLFCCFCF